MKLEVHEMLLVEGALGPGLRAAIFVQGCTLGCPGCFNPRAQAVGGGRCIPVAEVVNWVCSSGARAVTLTGGEPTRQAAAVAQLTRALRREGIDSILMYSGLRLEEICLLPDGPALLDDLDVLIDGQFEADRIEEDLLRGSSNQEIYLLTDRHEAEEFAQRPSALIVRDGAIAALGLDAPRAARSWRDAGPDHASHSEQTRSSREPSDTGKGTTFPIEHARERSTP